MANFIIEDQSGHEWDFQVNENGYLKTWQGPEHGYQQVFLAKGGAVSCTPETLEATARKYLKRVGVCI